MIYRPNPLALRPKREVMVGDDQAVFTFQGTISAGAQRLIWEEFFASRNRGINWSAHLPWAKEGYVFCASAVIDSLTVAALLVRPIAETRTAMIGYVCVDNNFRGHGLSGHLIDVTIAPLRDMGFDHLLLWTGRPGVYEKSGFRIIVQERRMMIQPAPVRDTTSILLGHWPSIDDADNDGTVPGLQAFATAAWQATSSNARIVLADTPMGPTLLDHAGAPDDVLRTMAAVRPGNWVVTIEQTHPLAMHANATGQSIEDNPGPVTMYRPLGMAATVPAYVPPALRI